MVDIIIHWIFYIIEGKFAFVYSSSDVYFYLQFKLTNGKTSLKVSGIFIKSQLYLFCKSPLRKEMFYIPSVVAGGSIGDSSFVVVSNGASVAAT